MTPSTTIALVTGATAGLGAAVVRRFIAEGRKVIAAGRRVDRLNTLARSLGPRVLPFALDVSDGDAISGLPGSLPEGWREVDILVNNAGLALGVRPAQSSRVEDWDRVLATNVGGLLHLTHALLPSMVRRDRGHIVNVGSVAGQYSYPGGNVYAASKAFVQHFTLNLKADLIGTHVRATTLAPGLVGETEFSDVRFEGDEAAATAVYEDLEYLTPDDMAEAVAWVVGLPPHVNVNYLEIMPTCQAPGPLVFKRSSPAAPAGSQEPGRTG